MGRVWVCDLDFPKERHPQTPRGLSLKCCASRRLFSDLGVGCQVLHKQIQAHDTQTCSQIQATQMDRWIDLNKSRLGRKRSETHSHSNIESSII